MREKLIFEHSAPGRSADAQYPAAAVDVVLPEALLLLDRPVSGVLDALAARGIVGGCDVTADYPSLGNGLLVCATEMRTTDDVEAYARALADVMKNAAAA